MSRSTLPTEMKSRLGQQYESDEEAKPAIAWAQAQPQATTTPKKAKKTTTDSLAVQLLQVLSESQATAQKIRQDKLEITTQVQGLGKSKTKAPKLKEFTEKTSLISWSSITFTPRATAVTFWWSSSNRPRSTTSLSCVK